MHVVIKMLKPNLHLFNKQKQGKIINKPQTNQTKNCNENFRPRNSFEHKITLWLSDSVLIRFFILRLETAHKTSIKKT